MQFTKFGGIVLLLLSCVLLIKHGTLPQTFEDHQCHTHCTFSLTNPYPFSSLTTYLLFLPSKRTGYAQVRHSQYSKFSTLRRARRLQGYSDNVSEESGVAIAEGLLGPDGSISEAYLKAMNADVDRLDLQWPLVGSPSFSSRGLDMEKKVMDFFPCGEGMRDAIPFENKKGKGKDACVIMVPPLYVRQFKWPHSQTKISHLIQSPSVRPLLLLLVYHLNGAASEAHHKWKENLNDTLKQARQQNVPNVPLLRSKQARAWVNVSSGSTIIFLPGGPMYPDGVAAYLDRLVQLVPELAFGETTRVVLDIEGGTGSLSQALAQRGVATLCIASYESPQDAIQLVMERGFPGLLTHSFSSLTRLPFPTEAFDMLHCAACDIPWSSHGGALLLEADRILRRGGFFVWKMDAPHKKFTWNGGILKGWCGRVAEMEKQSGKICWKLVTKADSIAVWHKPSNITATDCQIETLVPLCPLIPGPDAAWRVAIKSCIVERGKGPLIAKGDWKARLAIHPKRLQIVSAGGLQTAKQEVYTADFNYWVYLTDFYVRFFGPARMAEVRNVLDMSAGYGGFAAALALKKQVPWWVLNVVPVDGPDRLAVIFDRGLLGVYHDWCETLDVHPRTFDLIHASGFFSIKHRCSVRVIIQEMDRLLRPGGFALIRDHKSAVLRVRQIAQALQWKTSIDDTESGPMGTDKLLHCQKTKWKPRS